MYSETKSREIELEMGRVMWEGADPNLMPFQCIEKYVLRLSEKLD